MRWTRREVPSAAGVLLLGALLCGSNRPAVAGEQLTQAELLKRSLSVVEVEVRFEGKSKAAVKVLRWLEAKPSATTKVAWKDSACVTTRKNLHSWLRRFPKVPKATRRLWRRLARQRGYHAIFFVGEKRLAGRDPIRPYCEVEVQNLAHVDRHPDFAKWRKRLLAQIAARRRN